MKTNMAIKRQVPWPLKGQNLVCITHTMENMSNMGINCPRNTEKSSLMPKKLGKVGILKKIIKNTQKYQSHIHG